MGTRFYYTEGNIYAKLQQLEKDKDVIGFGTAGQYEKQKALLESVLPKTKSLDEIFISQIMSLYINLIWVM